MPTSRYIEYGIHRTFIHLLFLLINNPRKLHANPIIIKERAHFTRPLMANTIPIKLRKYMKQIIFS